MFKVMRHDADTLPVQPTQCGGAVKTEAKAMRLRQTMKDNQAPGSSIWFTIEQA